MTADIPAPSSYALAVDIGGTFTDVVLRNTAGKTWVDKTLTTPESLDVGFFRAVDAVLVKAAIKPTAVTDVVVHGSSSPMTMPSATRSNATPPRSS